MLYIKGIRIMMFQLSGVYCKCLAFLTMRRLENGKRSRKNDPSSETFSEKV